MLITDSLAYGKFAPVPWNIVSYNVFGGEARGPDLYGTEPWSYYFLNLALNFNFVALLALGSLPALLITHTIDYKRLGLTKHRADESSPYTILTLRLAPVYVWIGLLTAQSHKEERFMYPIYPLLCFNAAVTVYLFRGWLEAIYIKATASPYKVGLIPCQASETDLRSTGVQDLGFPPDYLEYHPHNLNPLIVSYLCTIPVLPCTA